MTLSFADAVGNLMNRLGKCGLLIKQARSNQQTQLTNMTHQVNGVVGQYGGEPDLQAIMGQSYPGLLDGDATAIGSAMQALAAATVNRMVFRDNPQLNQSFSGANVVASIQEVIRQMKIQATGGTVLAHTITLTPTSFTGSGNGVLVGSVRRPSDGIVLENAFAETLTALVTADSYLSGTAEGNEGLTVTGDGSQPNPFAFNWPLGSNATATLSTVNGNEDNAAGNLLTNSGFTDFDDTANVPDNWSLELGTAGTNIAEETGIVYDSGSALKITGDAGGTLTRLTQRFDIATGTLGVLTPLTQYAFNVFVRRDATAAAAGVLTIDLVDQNGTVIQDARGIDNSFTIDLTALTVDYTAYNGVFRTPHVMPTTSYLRIRLSTALTNGRSVYLDKAALAQMTQVYRSGPYLACFAGSIPFRQGDYASVTVTNSRGSGGTLDTFQTLWARLFPEMISNELILPSSNTPTISDNLIG